MYQQPKSVKMSSLPTFSLGLMGAGKGAGGSAFVLNALAQKNAKNKDTSMFLRGKRESRRGATEGGAGAFFSSCPRKGGPSKDCCYVKMKNGKKEKFLVFSSGEKGLVSKVIRRGWGCVYAGQCRGFLCGAYCVDA